MSSSSTCTLAFDGNHDNGEEIVDPEVPMENVAMATKMDNWVVPIKGIAEGVFKSYSHFWLDFV